MTEFSSRSLVCPVCDARFLVEVPLHAIVVGQETDLRPLVEGPDPIALDMHACPTCRYAGYALAFLGPTEDDVEEVERFGVPPPVRPLGLPDEDDLDALRRWIRRGELAREAGVVDHEPSPGERYLLAACCRELLGEDDPAALADLFLRGAWAARGTGERELEVELLEEASERLGQALEEGRIPPGERGRTSYLAAELARRAGDFARAVDLFGQVEAHVDLEEDDGQRFYRLARRMDALARLQVDVPARMPSDEDLEVEPLPGEREGAGGDDEDEDEA